MEDADLLPVSPRARRLLALERGEPPDVPSRVTSRRPPPPSTPAGSSSSAKDQRRLLRSKRLASDAPHGGGDRVVAWAAPGALLRLLAALLVALVVLDVTVESLAIAYCASGDATPTDPSGRHNGRSWLDGLLGGAVTRQPRDADADALASSSSCSPGVVDLEAGGRARHRFYDLLARRGPPTPPEFRGEFQVLCEPGVRHQSRFGYCLPIGGRTDEPFCARADRMDLLVANATDFCYASVLHMLFVDVFDELRALGATPLVAYGTLLGAVRNASMIPFTEDADIAHEPLAPDDLNALKGRLWRKGFHMFYYTRLWRVCVAPTHPLARVLFTPEKGLTRNYKVPYVDLYEMRPVEYSDGTFWDLFATRDDRLLPDDKVRPFSTVEINGMAFDTFADPVDFLVDEYGEDFRTPIAREQKKLNGFNFMEGFLDDDPDNPLVRKKRKKTNQPTADEDGQ